MRINLLAAAICAFALFGATSPAQAHWHHRHHLHHGHHRHWHRYHHWRHHRWGHHRRGRRMALESHTAGGTAVYNIRAHEVQLPNGRRLEAHSGRAWGLDNPRYVRERRLGPTPPGVYALAPRGWFHGAWALRLKPITARTFGRAGLLAHPCMLRGDRGGHCASLGCVSFRDYQKFLHAYLSGEVRRLEVVAGP